MRTINMRGAKDGLGMALLMLAIVAGFYWELTLTRQFDWIWGPDLAAQVLPWFQVQARAWNHGMIALWDPYQRRWGTPPAAWRDPTEMQAAEPRQCADIGTTNLTLSSAESHPQDNVPTSVQTNRFDHAPSPVRILMKDGVWLAPESKRPCGPG